MYDPYEELEAAIYKSACEDYVNFYFARPADRAHYYKTTAEKYILSDSNMVQKTIPGKDMLEILRQKALKNRYGKNRK